MCQKMNCQERRIACLNRVFPVPLELKGKKRVYHFWKRQATQEDHKDVVRVCREKIRRAEAQVELNLVTAIKDNKKCFYN